MIGLIVCAASLAGNPAGASPAPESYAEVRAKAGRSADGQVKLALWCESRGLTAERLHHLTLAVLADPGHAAARGLMGLVAVDGRWSRPEAVAAKVATDPALAEYEARRLDAPETLEGQLALGDWAAARGLADQARAHWIAANRIDPSGDEPWKRLGYKKVSGRWITDARALAEKREADAQGRADRQWKPILEEARRQLAIPARRGEGEATLAGVTDPRAVPSIGRVFASTEARQPIAVRLLGQVDAPSASRALASLSVLARSAEARRSATETLRGRDPRDYAEALIALLAEPIRFEVKHVAGPDAPGQLLIEGRQANLRRVYTPPSPFRPGDRPGFDDEGRPVVVRPIGAGTTAQAKVGALLDGFAFERDPMLVGGRFLSLEEAREAARLVEGDLPFRDLSVATRITVRFADFATIPLVRMEDEARKSAYATERALRLDVRALEQHNLAVRVGNDRVAGVLNDATGQSLPPARRAWDRWYVDHIGYASPTDEWASRPARSEAVEVAYQSPVLPEGSTRPVIGYERADCFAAGTPVQTPAGPRPIESLKVGDRVLTQSTASGSLNFRPILAAHRHPGLATSRVRLGGEAVATTPVHRFWVAGRGWVMARDLKPGDPVRTLGGVAAVESVEPSGTEPVYNLDVADDADFFVGPAAALVHDNTLPDPRLVPFDRPEGR